MHAELKLFANTDICVSHQGLVTAEVEKKSGDVSCVLCVGHNKGMEEAASSLAVRLSTCSCLDIFFAQHNRWITVI